MKAIKRSRNKTRLRGRAALNQYLWKSFWISPLNPDRAHVIATNGGATNLSATWNDLTAEQILHDFNSMIATVWGTRNRGTRERYNPSIQIVDGHPQNIYGKTSPTMLRHLYEPTPFHRDRTMVHPSGWAGDPIETEIPAIFNPAVNQQEKEPQQ